MWSPVIFPSNIVSASIQNVMKYTLITRSFKDIRFPPEASCNELSWLRKLCAKEFLEIIEHHDAFKRWQKLTLTS